jgi:putative DNA methylase
MKRAIEEDFPIVEINRLAVPERNSFKPIYQMHKWFARRASCVFRAILLSALKPAGTDIMAEFYRDHTNDPDTNGKVVLDPFMGGGTTVVEALRLGCKVVGVDLNPVAWFIVKTEVEPVDVAALEAAFDRLANRTIPWSGKPLRDTLLDLYKTTAPYTASGSERLGESDVIYTFWVKSAICTGANCGKQVPLFSDYVVAAKSPSIRYYPECECPKCGKKFDWEIEPAALVADPRLMLHSARNSNGKGSARWTYAHPDGGLYVAQGESDGTQATVRSGMLERGHVCCPHCYQSVKVSAYMQDATTRKKRKTQRKKVPLIVLLCPRSEEVFQLRGELPPDTSVTSPAGHSFDPHRGHVSEKGRYVCPHCGNNDSIIASVRALPEDQLLPMTAYGLQAYAPGCDPAHDPERSGDGGAELFDGNGANAETADEEEAATDAGMRYAGPFIPRTQNLAWKQSGKYYARHAAADQALYTQAEKWWEENKESLPWPKSKVPMGEKTKSGLLAHHYNYWHQLFLPRQLLALSTLLLHIGAEADRKIRHLLLCAFSNTAESNNSFTRNRAARNSPGGTAPGGIFSRHDFQPKATFCEQNVWGTVSGANTFISRMQMLRAGLDFARTPYEGAFDEDGKTCKRYGVDPIPFDADAHIICGDSRTDIPADIAAKIVITDPPYADNVNYSELADFFYVWLRLLLKDEDPQFAPEYCPKSAEIVENPTRGLSIENFEIGLTDVLTTSAARTGEDGLVVFTFHHAEGSSWESVLKAICNAGLIIEAIYPVHAESESSLHLMDKEAIAYDLVHVCRKRRAEDVATKRSWAGLRQLVRQRARDEIERIESGRYGGQPLPPPDVRMVLIGKCLEVYSRHYGAVLDWDGEPFPLRAALQDIRVMVEQIVSRDMPLPAELESADALSQVWLVALCDKREVSVDSISKLTRGVFEVSDLTGHKPPILRKGRMKGGRTYEVLTPLERVEALRIVLPENGPSAEQLGLFAGDGEATSVGPRLVDVLHFLIAHAEQGERLDHLVERFRGQREALRAALEYLQQRDPNRWGKACEKLLPFYSEAMLAKFFTQTT